MSSDLQPCLQGAAGFVLVLVEGAAGDAGRKYLTLHLQVFLGSV
jgi:hypothetical protein